MKIKLDFLSKAKAKPEPKQDPAQDEAALKQGGYTDHAMGPYALRMMIAPMYGEELEKFEGILSKLQDEYPDAKQSDLIDTGFDYGYFVYGKQGELRLAGAAK